MIVSPKPDTYIIPLNDGTDRSIQVTLDGRTIGIFRLLFFAIEEARKTGVVGGDIGADLVEYADTGLITVIEPEQS